MTQTPKARSRDLQRLGQAVAKVANVPEDHLGHFTIETTSNSSMTSTHVRVEITYSPEVLA